PIEGEGVEAVEDLQGGADVELGVPLVEAEEEAEDLVGRIGPEPDQGNQQARAGVVAIGVAGARGLSQGPPVAASGGGRSAGVALRGLELGGQTIELIPVQAGEAAEGLGMAAQRVIAEHRDGPSSG